ncbi:hypothetical protein GCM10020218_104390 [Dactylosporangium vinaceum]|uniref:Uncharacterized protein n=1 Tax=Dactylosporangium vinaceum TaxID=53362 RepID=A0ABV5MH27_9ACTN|nr:hypothetical protein [Dactylosporangium vinaceum]
MTSGSGAHGCVETDIASDIDPVAAALHALHTNGDLNTARRLFDVAYTRAEAAWDVPGMAEAALGFAGVWVHEHRVGAAAAVLEQRLTRLLGLVDPEGTLAVRLRARLAAERDYREGRSDAILAALEEARACGDTVAHAEALSLAHHCLLGPEQRQLRQEIATELLGVSTRTGRRGDLVMALLWCTADRFLDGDRHAERRLSELRGALADRPHLAAGYVADAIDVMREIRAGRFAEAEAAAAACFERGNEAGDADAAGWYGAQLVAIRWYQGRLQELRPMLDKLVHWPTLSVVDNAYFAVHAVAAAAAGETRTAAGALARLRGPALKELPRSGSWLVTMQGIVEAARLLGDAELAEEAYDLLLPHAEMPAMVSLGIACFGSVHHALGIAALVSGRRELAATHLTRAVEHNRALGHWPAAEESRKALERLEPAQPAPAVCVRERQHWRLTWGSRAVVVENSVGMLHLAVLLANAGTEIPAVELAMGVTGLAAAAGARSSPQAVLDEEAMRRYRHRVAELRDEMESSADARRAEAARQESEALLAELAGSVGIGGRSRRFVDNAERARVAVGKAIRRAIARVEEADAALGRHLRETVHTGRQCSYRPL